MKKCSDCERILPESAFSKQAKAPDGLAYRCKECRHYEYLANIDRYKERDRVWRKKNAEKSREATKRYRGRHPDRVREHAKAWYLKNKDYYKKFPEKVKARKGTRKMQRPVVCSGCGREGFVEGHHADYGKPFEVTWLCSECHGKVHRKIG